MAIPRVIYSLTLLLRFLWREGPRSSLELLGDRRPRDFDRTRSSRAFPAAAAKPPAASPLSPPPSLSLPRDLARERERERDRVRDLSRGPLRSRFPTSPPTTASNVCRVPFLLGSLLTSSLIPPALMAAVRIRLPFSPVHPPGSFRLRIASVAPASTAAFNACCTFCDWSTERELERELEEERRRR